MIEQCSNHINMTETESLILMTLLMAISGWNGSKDKGYPCISMHRDVQILRTSSGVCPCSDSLRIYAEVCAELLD